MDTTMMVTGNVCCLVSLLLLADLVVNTLPCSRAVVGRMVALHARIGQVSDDIKAGFDFK